jgi:hypothetical protein
MAHRRVVPRSPAATAAVSPRANFITKTFDDTCLMRLTATAHIIRVFCQDWYRLNAEECIGKTWADDVPDRGNPKPCGLPQASGYFDHYLFAFNRAKMLEHWDKGLWFDRANADFVTPEEYGRRHPNAPPRKAPELGRERRMFIRRERRLFKIERTIWERHRIRSSLEAEDTLPDDG